MSETKEKKSYPAPKDGKKFVEMWYKYLPSVMENPKFREHHLDALEILCSLHQDRQEMEDALQLLGKTYETVDKGIVRVRPRPEIVQVAKIRDQIKNYMVVLGLTLVKHRDRKDNDHMAGASSGEQEQWD